MSPVAALRTKDDDAHPHPSTHAPDLAGLSLEPTPKSGGSPVPRPPDSLMVPARTRHPPVRQYNMAGRDGDGGDDDPFSDDNVVRTPMYEREEPRW